MAAVLLEQKALAKIVSVFYILENKKVQHYGRMVEDMKILSEMPTGIGGKWVLVKYDNDFYAYGTEDCLHDLLGFPVDQCGSKEDVIKHCKSISELCKQNIKKYNKELIKEKEKPDGWKLLIEHEQKELEMLTEFARILSE